MESARDKLTAYHKSEKVRDGIGFIAKPPEPLAPQPKPDPLVVAQIQIATAFLELSKIYKNPQD